MLKPHRTYPHPDLAAAFREGVGRLERPDRRQTEAARLRICLAASSRGGLMDRLRAHRLPAPRAV